MCQFFSFVTDPVGHPAEYYYFDWDWRKANLDNEGADSHSHICTHFNLNEDKCNKYEFNPLTGEFVIDQINSKRDDSEAAEKWVKRLDFKTVIEPLIIKPIVNPFELPAVEKVTDEHIQWLKEWASVVASVGDAVRYSVWASIRDAVMGVVTDAVWDSVGDLVGDPVWASVRDAVGASVGDAVGASVGAYTSTFFDIQCKRDYSSAIKLWEAGLVPSFDGNTWRLRSGERAAVVFEWVPEVQE